MTKLNDIKSNRPPSIAFTSRCDIKSLATLVHFWRDKGEPIRSISELVRLSIESFKDLVTNKWPEYEIESASDALELLRKNGLSSGHRNKSTLLKQMQVEDLILEGFDPSYALKTKTKLPKPLIDEAVRRYQEKRDEERRNEDEDGSE